MKLPAFSMAAALVLGFALPTASQSVGASPSELDTPEACRGASLGMPNMAHSLSASMANMSDAQKAYLQAVVKMQLTTGVMIKDPDVAFFCLMIPHHQGAIDMARVVLKYGKEAETRKMAEAAIATQEKEIIEMKAWLAQKPASNASAPRSP
jgi:uncharacterized protein (DUF305 family)